MTLDTIHHLVNTYGYWLMAFGAIIEGETFLLAGGIAISHGWLGLSGCILLAVIGSTFHDCFFFLIGRYGGDWLFKRKPLLQQKADSVIKLFDKYGVWLIVFMRFAYGLRTIIPAAIGMSHITKRKFLVYDVLGGIIWSSCFILGGLFLGNVLTRLLHRLGHVEHIIFRIVIVLIVLALAISFGTWIIKKFRNNKRS